MTSSAGGRASERSLQIMYGIAGEHDLTERELPHLRGWRNSAPVRVGNGAWGQTQLDVYGELLNSLYLYREQFGELHPEIQAFVADLDANASAAIWRDYARAGRRMDGTLPAVTGNVTAGPVTYAVDTDGQVSEVNGFPPKSVTDDHRGVRVSLSEAVGGGYVPGATLKALRMDRHRSDKGELPEGLVFPEVAGVRGEKTELFWSGELAAFNAARRGSWPVTRDNPSTKTA